jgi:hypothetical protein
LADAPQMTWFADIRLLLRRSADKTGSDARPDPSDAEARRPHDRFCYETDMVGLVGYVRSRG